MDDPAERVSTLEEPAGRGAASVGPMNDRTAKIVMKLNSMLRCLRVMKEWKCSGKSKKGGYYRKKESKGRVKKVGEGKETREKERAMREPAK